MYNNSIKPENMKKNGIVFIGGLHMPNEDGVLWFTKEIFPIIKRRIPGIKFVV